MINHTCTQSYLHYSFSHFPYDTRSLGGPTGLFSKALRDAGKKISVSSLKGMGLRDDR